MWPYMRRTTLAERRSHDQQNCKLSDCGFFFVDHRLISRYISTLKTRWVLKISGCWRVCCYVPSYNLILLLFDDVLIIWSIWSVVLILIYHFFVMFVKNSPAGPRLINQQHTTKDPHSKNRKIREEDPCRRTIIQNDNSDSLLLCWYFN